MSNPNTMSRERFLLEIDRADDPTDFDILIHTFRDDDDSEWEAGDTDD